MQTATKTVGSEVADAGERLTVRVRRSPTNTLRRVGIDALFVLGVPISEVELHYFRFDRAYDGCIHHAVIRGRTLCGLSTAGSNCEGRTLGDNECDGTNVELSDSRSNNL